VKKKEPVGPKITALYSKIKNPVMTGLKIKLQGVRIRDGYPRELGDLFDGDQIVLVGRYDWRDTDKLGPRRATQRSWSSPACTRASSAGSSIR